MYVPAHLPFRPSLTSQVVGVSIYFRCEGMFTRWRQIRGELNREFGFVNKNIVHWETIAKWNIGVVILAAISIIVAVFLILKAEKKEAAVGRRFVFSVGERIVRSTWMLI